MKEKNKPRRRLLGEGRKRKDRLKHIFVYGIMAVPIIHFFVFYIAVNFETILLPFMDDNTGKFTLDNFRFVFQAIKSGDVFLIAFRNTIIYWISGLFCSYVLSLFVAYFLYKKIWGYRLFTFMAMVPSMVSGVVLVAIYKNVLGTTGPIAVIYERLFNEPFPQLLYTNETATWTIVAYTIWVSFGVNLIMYSGTLAKIPQEIVEAAQIDGVGFIQEFFSIELPMMGPTIVIMILFSVAGVLSASGPILLFTGGMYETTTIGYWFYEQVIVNQNYGISAAFGLLLSAVGIPLVLIVNHFSKKIEVVEF